MVIKFCSLCSVRQTSVQLCYRIMFCSITLRRKKLYRKLYCVEQSYSAVSKTCQYKFQIRNRKKIRKTSSGEYSTPYNAQLNESAHSQSATAFYANPYHLAKNRSTKQINAPHNIGFAFLAENFLCNLPLLLAGLLGKLFFLYLNFLNTDLMDSIVSSNAVYHALRKTAGYSRSSLSEAILITGIPLRE